MLPGCSHAAVCHHAAISLSCQEAGCHAAVLLSYCLMAVMLPVAAIQPYRGRIAGLPSHGLFAVMLPHCCQAASLLPGCPMAVMLSHCGHAAILLSCGHDMFRLPHCCHAIIFAVMWPWLLSHCPVAVMLPATAIRPPRSLVAIMLPCHCHEAAGGC